MKTRICILNRPQHFLNPIGAAALVGFVLVLALPKLDAQDSTIQFSDVTAESGIEFVHTHGGSGQGYIVEGMSTGIATFDYDQDGLTDIYFLNGSPLKGNTTKDQPQNRLYRNLGGMKFEDVTERTGAGDQGYALGVAVADYDNDGNLDIYINNFGPNTLLRNKGNGTFENMTAQAGVANGDRVGAGVGFADFDGDGDLDLYVANYVNFTYENHIPIVVKGARFQAGPQYYDSIPDSLYFNNGDGTFSEVTEESGIGSRENAGMGLVCLDVDNDQDVDVYVCNDGEPNCLWINEGKGKFTEQAVLLGCAYDAGGRANASMGVDIADFDGDGLFDLFVTAYQSEMPQLYRNLDGLYMDATLGARIPRLLYPHVHWGTAFVDLDNDADNDLFVACGHFDRVEQIDDRTTQKIRNFVLQNSGGRYEDISDKAGAGLQILESSRGAALEDFDNDGDMDMIIVNSNEKPSLLRNDLKSDSSWIHLDLHQDGPNQFAVGATVQVLSKKPQVRPVLSGRGYQSHFGSRLHFGLGEEKLGKIDVEVTWPDGTGTIHTVESNQISKIQKP